jgi:hypothetical protein
VGGLKMPDHFVRKGAIVFFIVVIGAAIFALRRQNFPDTLRMLWFSIVLPTSSKFVAFIEAITEKKRGSASARMSGGIAADQ